MRVALYGGPPASLTRRRVAAAGVGMAMALATLAALPATATAVAPPTARPGGATGAVRDHTGVTPAAQTLGVDVNASQGNVDWPAAWADGARFAYVEATEGTTYTNPYFATQTAGASAVGMEHGAYHFANPNASSGQTQADFFVAHGGGWSRDGQTLPPLLDIEASPFGDVCYGMSQAAMVTWLKNFTAEVRARTTRWPVIYTSTSWWTTCTGNDASFGANDPLFVAGTSSGPGPLPAGWTTATFWQSTDSGVFPGGEDWFNGTPDQLKAFADG